MFACLRRDGARTRVTTSDELDDSDDDSVLIALAVPATLDAPALASLWRTRTRCETRQLAFGLDVARAMQLYYLYTGVDGVHTARRVTSRAELRRCVRRTDVESEYKHTSFRVNASVAALFTSTRRRRRCTHADVVAFARRSLARQSEHAIGTVVKGAKT